MQRSTILFVPLLLPTLLLAAYVPILPTGETAAGQTWKYTTTAPAATWNQPSFSDAAWLTGSSGFGSTGTPGITVRTQWTAADIWMRTLVTTGSIDSFLNALTLRIIHDETVEVYINGVLAFSEAGYIAAYKEVAVSAAARAVVRSNSATLIAVHCHQTAGGQCVDVGLGYQLAPPTTGYRNIARNPQDVHDSVWKKLAVPLYPHATSNSECRMEAPFLARNAINDTIRNTGHGAGFPSWGPEQVTNATWKVDFGKPMAVDSVTIYIRADFPHDGYWYTGRLCFSDSSKVTIRLDSTARAQGFKFSRRKTNWMRIDSLIWHIPNTWCAISQVQVWGDDSTVVKTINTRPDRSGVRIQSSVSKAFSGKQFLLNGKNVSPSAKAVRQPAGVRITADKRNLMVDRITQ